MSDDGSNFNEDNDVPPKKKMKNSKREIKQCFICKKNTKSTDSYKSYTYNPSLNSLENLLSKIRTRYENRELELGKIHDRVKVKE